ncbi:MAG: hypothetical protein H0W50_01295 [Parachlamydiaceae bacterium]|nr:hypothetical protein [Parachlamydiaceae bacterium]
MQYKTLFGRVQAFSYEEKNIYLDKTKSDLDLLKSCSITSRFSQLNSKKASESSANNQ